MNIYFDDEKKQWCYTAKTINRTKMAIEYETRSGFASMETAQQMCMLEEELFNKEIENFKRVAGSNPLFSAYLITWFDTCIKGIVKISYETVIHWTIYNVIIPTIKEDLVLTNISAVFIERLLKDVSNVSRTAPETVYKILNLMFIYAMENRKLTYNPMTNIKRPKIVAKKVQLFNKDELKRFLKYVREYESDYYLEILLLCFCGLRYGEVRGLKWCDVELDRTPAILTVNRQVTGQRFYRNGRSFTSHKSIETPPKTENAYRSMYLPDVIKEELLKRKRKLEQVHKDFPENWADYVCVNQKGEVYSDGTITGVIRRSTLRAGITKKCSPRILRHLFATLALENGMPIEAISKIMGHARVSTTFNIYMGVSDGDLEVRNFINNIKLDPVSQNSEFDHN